MYGQTTCPTCGVTVPIGYMPQHKCDNDTIVEYEAKKFAVELEKIEGQMTQWENNWTKYYRWRKLHSR